MDFSYNGIPGAPNLISILQEGSSMVKHHLHLPKPTVAMTNNETTLG